jgi:hypothetical protein
LFELWPLMKNYLANNYHYLVSCTYNQFFEKKTRLFNVVLLFFYLKKKDREKTVSYFNCRQQRKIKTFSCFFLYSEFYSIVIDFSQFVLKIYSTRKTLPFFYLQYLSLLLLDLTKGSSNNNQSMFLYRRRSLIYDVSKH